MEQAARREFKEETGVDIVDDLQYLGSFEQGYDYQDTMVPVTTAVFTCKLPANATIVAGDDAAECKLFPRAEIPFKKIAFSNQSKFVEDYLA